MSGSDRGWTLARLGLIALLCAAGIGASACVPAGSADDGREGRLVVFAASSLADAAQALADSFRVSDPTVEPQIALASSSVLARQIERGAPADVFLSANQDWIVYLDSLSLLAPHVRLPITNAIVRFSRPRALASDGRIAIGDPDHVPVGRYARDLLVCDGSWDALADRIVPTADARSAISLLRSGAVDHALSYQSDYVFLGPTYDVVEMTAGCMPDIGYFAATVVRTERPDAAARFVSYLASPEAGAVWQEFGFRPVQETGAVTSGGVAGE